MWDKNSDLDDYLAHYGVLGMKWGVRKARNSGPSTTSKLRTALKKKSKPTKEPERNSFTEGGLRKADVVITEKDKKRRRAKLKEQSQAREKEWQKLYVKRDQMGDRELQLALNRLKLENQLAKEVATASTLTPKPKNFIEKHGTKVVIANTIVGSVASNIDNPNAKKVALISDMLSGIIPNSKGEIKPRKTVSKEKKEKKEKKENKENKENKEKKD